MFCSPSILKCTETRTVEIGVGGSRFFHLTSMQMKTKQSLVFVFVLHLGQLLKALEQGRIFICANDVKVNQPQIFIPGNFE